MAAKPRFPWIGVSAGVAVVVVATVAWLQIPGENMKPSHAAGRPSLSVTRMGVAGSAELLTEQLAAYDPTPIFMPSPMSSSALPLPGEALPAAARPGVGGPFAALSAELTKTGPLRLPLPVSIPAGPVAGLRLTERADAPLAMARADTLGKALVTRLGRVEALSLESGRMRLALDMTLPADPPEGDWQPLELMGAVTREGLAGELVITTSSGSSEIDDFFRFHLKQNLRLGARLSPGFYVFRVGP